jgi:hypothetical protein
MKFIFDILLKLMPFPTSSDAFLEVPEDKKYCLCPDCDSLLGMSYFNSTKCGCGFHGKPNKTLTQDEAKNIFQQRMTDHLTERSDARCCFNCKYWNGKRRKDRAYCYRLNLSGKDATHGNEVCGLWGKRINSRV